MLIAISGASGSGKSSIIKMLKVSLETKGLEVVVQEEDSFLFLKLFKKLLNKGGSIKNDLTEDMYIEKKRSFLQNVSLYLYAKLILVETYLVYCYYEFINSNKILIKDRYTLDYLVTLEQNFKFKNRLIRYLYTNFPKPFLHVVLNADFNTIYERNKKNKYWLEHSGNKKEHYEDILSSYEYYAMENNLILLENNSPVEEVVEKIMRAFLVKRNIKANRSIHLMGIDGTGKSTISEMLSEYFRKLGFRSKVVHFYHNSLLFQFLLWIGYFKKSKETEESMKKNQKKAIEASKKGKPFYWGLFHFSDGVFQSVIFRILYPRTILIFDRSLHDFIVSFEHYRVPYREIFEKIIPKHKNGFCLVCSPEISYSRKPENSLEFFKSANLAYEKLIKKEKLFKIDTEANDADAVYNIVLERLAENK